MAEAPESDEKIYELCGGKDKWPNKGVVMLIGKNLGDEVVAQIAKAMQYMPKLEKLNLEGNNIGDEGAIALGQVLHCTPMLWQISLEDNKIGDSGAAKIAEALPHLPLLKEIYLKQNKVADKGATALGQALASMPKKAEVPAYLPKKINYYKVLTPEEDGTWLVERSSKYYKRKTEVSDLFDEGVEVGEKVHGVDEGEECGDEWVKCTLTAPIGLTGLYLEENEIGDDGAAALAQAFSSMPLLRLAGFGQNQIGDTGAGKIAEALPHMTSLQRLDLSFCKISAAGEEQLKKTWEELGKTKEGGVSKGLHVFS